MDKRYHYSHLNINLNFDRVEELNYEKKPVPMYQEERWRAQGYEHRHINGSVYNMGEPEAWCLQSLNQIATKLELINCGFSFYRMRTMEVMPVHSDHYEIYSNIFNVDIQNIHRAIVFLQPWKPGHYFEIDGDPIVDWSYGNYVIWQGDVPHMAANIGLADRYTLQITGMKNANNKN